MDKGKERYVISPLNVEPYVSNNVLEKGYGKIDAEALIEKTRAPRLNPRDNMSYFAPSTPPISRQKGITVKEDLYNG